MTKINDESVLKILHRYEMSKISIFRTPLSTDCVKKLKRCLNRFLNLSWSSSDTPVNRRYNSIKLGSTPFCMRHYWTVFINDKFLRSLISLIMEFFE